MAQIIIADGTSSLIGTAGDDEYVTAIGSPFLSIANDFAADTGFDILRLNPAANPAPAPQGALTSYTFADMRSIEQVSYANAAGQWTVFLTSLRFITEGTTLVGSTGRDGAIFRVSSPGDYTMPLLNFSNWGPAANLSPLSGDYVLLVAGDGGAHTLRARDDFGSLQVLQGGPGSDVLYGSNGQDILQISAGSDQYYAGAGDDAIVGPPAPLFAAQGQVIDGGEGTDMLVVVSTLTLADATITDIEKVRFSSATNPVLGPTQPRLEITAQNFAPTVEASGGGQFFLYLSDGGFADLSGVTFADGASITISIDGSDAEDSITGSSVDDVITGRGGNDLVRAGNGNDTVYGGSGNHRLFGENGDDYMVDDEGDDVMSGGAGNDVIIGGRGRDEITGNDDDDILFGGGDNDLLRGGPGNDNVSGEGGDDQLFGGAGFDVLTGGLGNDILDGGTGTDFLVFVQSPINGGHDRIVQFAAEDFLITLEPLADGNGDGIIGFGSDRTLNIGADFDVRITGTNGRPVTALELDGSFFVDAGFELFVYSRVGSTLDFREFIDLP